jgi:molybdenum cofactor cytidylyltransferase
MTAGFPVILLAAGQGLRMDGADKLVLPENAPMLRRAALAAQAAGPLIVALPPEDDPAGAARRAVLQGVTCRIVPVPGRAAGIGASLAAAAAALPAGADAAFVALGDMPDLKPDHYHALARASGASPVPAIFRAATATGVVGHPVLIPAALFPALRALRADEGARALFAASPLPVVAVPTPGEAAALDIDTPEALADWQAQAAQSSSRNQRTESSKLRSA